MSTESGVSIDLGAMVKNYHKSEQDPLAEVMRNAIIANGIEKVAFNTAAKINLQNNFNIEIKSGKITSQEKSGRCWMFAGLNLFRKKITETLNIEDFEFSQNFPMFFDKLEKANYFLESIIATLDEDIYSRIIMWLLRDPLQDGGQWDMFVNLIYKYGAVPKSVMPETFHSSNSSLMNQLLTALLRQWAAELRKKYHDGRSLSELRKQKVEYMTSFYRLLCYFLGEPPLEFHFEYRDKENKHRSINGLTPLIFFREFVRIDLENYVSLIHAPTPDKPFGKTYTIEYLGNVIEGRKVLYLNTELEQLKLATVNQLKENEPVWFGCDVRLQTEKQKGLMDSEIFLYNRALGTEYTLNKADRLLYGESMLTHAMVFTGVNLDKTQPNRWKVENSWGEDRGEKGFFVMSDRWFDEYNYQVVIHKKYLTEEMKTRLEQEPVVLPPWDPMGSLAITR